jgi:hypothetical protein
MSLSPLQKSILKQCLKQRGKAAVEVFEGSRKIIRKSIDRLIKKELLVGFGEKTPHKLYLNEVKLTSKGRKAVKELMPRQAKIPL